MCTYFVTLTDKAVGPFLNREAAYKYAADKDMMVGQYAVKSDEVCQQEYGYLPIVKPD